MPPCGREEFAELDIHKRNHLNRFWDRHPWAYCELIMRPWIEETDDDPHNRDGIVLFNLNRVSVSDEATAIRLVRLPLWDTIERYDGSAMSFLADLSAYDPEGFSQLLSSESVFVAKDTPIQLQYLEMKDPDAAAAMSRQDWYEEVVYVRPSQILNNLVETAVLSDDLFRFLMEGTRTWFVMPWEPHQSTAYILVRWTRFDQDTVLRLMSMPFLKTIETTDYYVMEWLFDLVEADPGAVHRIMSRPNVEDGVNDAEAIYLGLFVLEESEPQAALAINGLSWVQDGIKYVPPRNWTNVQAPPADFETRNVRTMISIALMDPEFLVEFTQKPWVRDGLNYDESVSVTEFATLLQRTPEFALRVLNLPFLANFDKGDSWTLSQLVQLTSTDMEAFERELERLEAAEGS